MKMRVRFPLSQLVSQLRQAQGLLASDKKRHLEAIGVQLLSYSQQAYRQKARGQKGADGITWRKLKRSTLKARVMRRAAGKKIIEQRKALARQIQQLIGVKTRRRGKPKPAKGVKGRRRGGLASRLKKSIGRTLRAKSPTKSIKKRLKRMPKIKGKGRNIKQQVQKLRRKRLELLLKLSQLVDREVGKHEIGVDTGLQRSSATPGFVGSDGQGGNLLQATESRVTVGYNRVYSPFFDEARPLLPERIPAPWATRFDRMTTKWAEDVMNRAFKAET